MVHHQLMSQQMTSFFSPHSKKAHSLDRMVSSGISDVVITSVHSEKICLNKLMLMKMIIVTSNSNTTFFKTSM